MQKTKKMLSLLLVVVFAFAMMVPTAFAAQFSDVPESYRYYEAIENLAARGIINGMGDGTFAPDANVKRDEFAKIVCIGLLNTGDVAPAAGAGFTDVADDRWSSGFIKVAAGAGIINGMGDGTFAPENPVTYEQAIKMLVCALGYDAQAQQKGGYPNGYLTLAGSLGLLKNVNDGAIGTPANRGLIAKLVDNSLTVDVFDPLTGKTTGSISEKNDKQSVKGQVVSVYGSTINVGEESSCGKKQIEIQKGSSTETYSIEKLNINPNDYLGRMVIAYYDDVAGAEYYELTSLSLQKGRNSVTKIDLGTIENYENTFIEYLPSEDADYEKALVDSDAVIMYNGVATTKSLSNILDAANNASGEITLLDTAGDGSASVVFVKLYETIVVGNIIKNSYKLYDKITSKEYVFDEKDRSKNITITKDGKTVEFSSIATNNILSVATSADGKTIEVLVSANNTTKGPITEISSDCMTIRVNNKQLKVAKSYAEKAKEQFSNDFSAIFYLDAFGKVAYADASGSTTASAYKYAYLVGAEKESPTSDRVDVKLYDISGSSTPTSRRFQLKEKGFKLNGTTYSDANNILSELEASAKLVNVGEAAKGALQYSQIIKYSLDGSVIDKIITYQTNEEGEPVYDPNNSNVLNVENIDAAGIKAVSTSKLGKYSVSGAKVLVLPENRSSGKYTGKSSSSFKTAAVYKVQIIDASNNMPKIVLLYGENAVEEEMEDIRPAVIKSVSGSKQVDGFDTPPSVLTVLDINGNEVEYYSDGSEEYSKLGWKNAKIDVPNGEGKFHGLQIGDIVKVRADDVKKIEEIMLVAKAEDVVSGNMSGDILTEGSNGNQINAQYRYFMGTVRKTDTTSGNLMILTPKMAADEDFANEDLDETYSNVSSNVPIYVVDTKETRDQMKADKGVFENLIAVEGIQDPKDASKIFIFTSYESIKMIVIFK